VALPISARRLDASGQQHPSRVRRGSGHPARQVAASLTWKAALV